MGEIFIKKDLLSKKVDNFYELLASNSNCQIILQKFKKGMKIYFTPSTQKEVLQFFYIIEGKINFLDEDEIIVLSNCDSFYSIDHKSTKILEIIEDTTALFLSTEEVFEEITSLTDKYIEMLDLVNSKDHYTKGHCYRVGQFSITLSQYINKKIRHRLLFFASQLHDLGKCMIPDEVLLKPGFFTEEERSIMNMYSTYSSKMLNEDFGFEPEICMIAECHHERYDGSGYPYGLKGDEIPLESRIIAITDTFDAICTKRPYQDARTPEEAIVEMERFSHQFDPEIFIIFKELVHNKTIDYSKVNEDIT